MSEKENKDQPAFPIVEDNVVEGQVFQEVHYFGLSKREYFAGLALQGLLANQSVTMAGVTVPDKIKSALLHADELLNQISQ